VKHPMWILAALLVTTSASGGGVRTLEHTQPAATLTGIRITAGVGEVEVLGDNGSDIRARVEVKPKHVGLFGSGPSDRELSGLTIASSTSGGTLVLRVAPDGGGDRTFSETWTVYVPNRFAASVKLGVGNVTLLDLTGDLHAELGVGNVKIEGSYAAFGDVHATCGVGDASLRTPERHDEGEGFIAHRLNAQGPGKNAIRAEVGVGDVTIRLR
jgi:hypothetical protein